MKNVNEKWKNHQEEIFITDGSRQSFPNNTAFATNIKSDKIFHEENEGLISGEEAAFQMEGIGPGQRLWMEDSSLSETGSFTFKLWMSNVKMMRPYCIQ